MARIYKESRYVLQLLIGKSYGAQYDDVKISFYTKNPSNQVMADNDITIKGNIAEVMVDSTLFDNLEEGLISYIVYGTKDGIPFIEERQSNYFLKTPLDSNNPGDIKATILEATITENGTYNFKPKTDAYLNPIEKWEGATITVDVMPKINIQEAGIKLAYGTFTEVPEWADFEGITDMSEMFVYCANLQTMPQINTSNVTNMSNMFACCRNLQTIPLIDTSNVIIMSYMFYECNNLQTIPLIDTSNVTEMYNMFDNCRNLLTIPQINTSNVTDMDKMFYNCNKLQTIPLLNTINVTNMKEMFYNCNKLQTIPSLDTSKVTDMNNMFGNCDSLVSLPAFNAQSLNMSSSLNDGIFGNNELPNLTDFGGFLNLKCSLTNDNNLQRLPNLTHQSCINVLNGLYDFVAAGETPNIVQGKLKVHPNFLTTVGDEISIGVNKGWQITS